MKIIHNSVIYGQSVVSGQNWYTIRVNDQSLYLSYPHSELSPPASFLTVVNFSVL